MSLGTIMPEEEGYEGPEVSVFNLFYFIVLSSSFFFRTVYKKTAHTVAEFAILNKPPTNPNGIEFLHSSTLMESL